MWRSRERGGAGGGEEEDDKAGERSRRGEYVGGA
jgi:hypothetical protein